MRKLSLVFGLGFFICGTGWAAETDKPMEKMPAMPATAAAPLEKTSYIVGWNLASNFSSHHVMLDADSIAMGVRDALSGRASQLSASETEQVMMDLKKKLEPTAATTMPAMENMKKDSNGAMSATSAPADISATNKDLQAKFLAANAKELGVITTASGLQYKVVEEGKGVIPQATDTVTVDYEGKLLSGKIFDSSYQKGKPVQLAIKDLIPGWIEALQKMKVGSTWMLYVPAELGYGKNGMPGSIGPDEMLIFKMHLIDIKR